jgi:hypothetical protein
MAGLEDFKKREMKKQGDVPKDCKAAGVQAIADQKRDNPDFSPEKEKKEQMKKEGDVKKETRTSGVQAAADYDNAKGSSEQN